MGKRRFRVEFSGDAIIEIDDAVIDAVDDEWRAVFYDLYTPEDIAEHIAYNLIVNHARLSMLDGWADKDDSLARLVEEPDWDMYAYDPVGAEKRMKEALDSVDT